MAEAPAALQPSAGCLSEAFSAQCEQGFCRINAGCFIMGAPRGEFGAALYANRQVEVHVNHAFLIGRTEMTRGAWQHEGIALPEAKGDDAGDTLCTGGDCPVANVSFFDAVAFANEYSKHRHLQPCYRLRDCTGKLGQGLVCGGVESVTDTLQQCAGYRLPTEAEWEFAARAGTRDAFYSGPITRHADAACVADPKLDPIGWYCINSPASAQPVAKKLPNAAGLYDMLGNVFEWCNDLKNIQGYGTGPLTDPMSPGGRELSATQALPYRVARGGAFTAPAVGATVSVRPALPDATAAANLGFRLVRTLPVPHGARR